MAYGKYFRNPLVYTTLFSVREDYTLTFSLPGGGRITYHDGHQKAENVWVLDYTVGDHRHKWYFPSAADVFVFAAPRGLIPVSQLHKRGTRHDD
jgi:hypothetical protein